jgi:hypothetical protein
VVTNWVIVALLIRVSDSARAPLPAPAAEPEIFVPVAEGAR